MPIRSSLASFSRTTTFSRFTRTVLHSISTKRSQRHCRCLVDRRSQRRQSYWNHELGIDSPFHSYGMSLPLIRSYSNNTGSRHDGIFGTKEAYSGDMAELNADVENLLGPLGDPDYDGDPLLPATKTASRRPTTTTIDTINADRFLTTRRNTQMDGIEGSINSTHLPLTPELAAVDGSSPRMTKTGDEKIDSIIADHATALRRVMYEVLENHHVGLAAAIRTELRLREMRPEK